MQAIHGTGLRGALPLGAVGVHLRYTSGSVHHARLGLLCGDLWGMETVLFAHIRVGDGPRVGACQASSWRRVRCRGLTAVVESTNFIQTLLPFAGISDLVKGAQLGGIQSFVVSTPHDGGSTGFRAMLGEVAVAALGTTPLIRCGACREWTRILRTPLRTASKSSPLGLDSWAMHLCPW